MEDKKSFTKEVVDGIKESILRNIKDEDDREIKEETLRNWRSWGSWFSWGSPVGLGLFLISIGIFLVLLHLAGGTVPTH